MKQPQQAKQSPKQIYESLRLNMWGIYKMKLEEVCVQATSLIGLNLQDNIVFLFEECISTSRSHSYLISYFQLMYLLLRNPVYNPILQQNFHDLVIQIFRYLHKYKRTDEIYRFKILRKYMVGLVHPLILDNLKHSISGEFKIDLEDIYKFDMEKLRVYYTGTLRMTRDALYYHLPKYHNELARIERKALRPQRCRRSPSQSISVNYNDSEDSICSSQHKTESDLPISPQTCKESQEETSDSLTKRKKKQKRFSASDNKIIRSIIKNMSKKPKNPSSTKSRLKSGFVKKELVSERMREEKQGLDLNLAIDTADSEQQLLPIIQQVFEMLNNLSISQYFSCSQCGVRFNLECHLFQHRIGHIDERLAKLQVQTNFEQDSDSIRKSKLSGGLNTVDQWINGVEEDSIPRKVKIPRDSSEYIECYFCKKSLSEIEFSDDEWYISDAVKIKVKDEVHVAHYRCFQENMKIGCIELDKSDHDY